MAHAAISSAVGGRSCRFGYSAASGHQSAAGGAFLSICGAVMILVAIAQGVWG